MTIKMVQTGKKQLTLIVQSVDDGNFVYNTLVPQINEYNENRRKMVYEDD